MSRKPPKTTARRPPTESDSSADQKKDADWGFKQDDKEKVLEPRLGIILAISLVLMFGFVLYHKYQSIQKAGPEPMAANREDGSSGEKPDSGSSQQPTTGTAATVSADQSGKLTPAQHFDPPAAHAERTPTLAETTFGPTASATSSGGGANFNPFTSEPASGESSGTDVAGPPAQREPSPFGEPAQSHLAASPGDHAADANPFFHEGSSSREYELSGTFDADEAHSGSPSAASSSASTPATWGSAGGTDLAFGAPAESADQHGPQPLESVSLAMPQAPPQAPPSQAEPDPFALDDPYEHDSPRAHENTPSAVSFPREEPNPFGSMAESEPQAHGQGTPHSDWSFDGGSRHQSAEAPHPLPAPELPGHQGQSESSFATANSDWDLKPVPQHDPVAARTDGHGHQFQFPPSPQGHLAGTGFSAQAAPQAVVGEREVTVKRNDSLWSICQDAYGTARYVPALARYNRERVPHPNKLRRGVLVRIPPPEVLEAHFPELFHRAGRRDAMVSPAGGTSPRASRSAQSGLFSDATGRPHYRVGKYDTLSRIAQRYLTRASRWTEILAMNHDRLKNPESLKPGMILRMPRDAAPVAVFSGSSSSR